MNFKNILITSIGLFVLSFSFFSCEKETEKLDEEFFGYEYYPVSVGNEWVYKVDSLLYSNDGIFKDTASWYIREKITKIHKVGNEENNYVVERSKSKDNINWTISDIWTIKKTDSNIQKTEENLTFIKLIFPPKKGKGWDGNAFINPGAEVSVFGENFKMFENWSYKITEEIPSMNLGGKTYDNVIKVREVDEESIVNLKRSYAHYAKGVGLILEERSILFDQPNNTEEIEWAIKADMGFILRRELISHNIK